MSSESVKAELEARTEGIRRYEAKIAKAKAEHQEYMQEHAPYIAMLVAELRHDYQVHATELIDMLGSCGNLDYYACLYFAAQENTAYPEPNYSPNVRARIVRLFGERYAARWGKTWQITNTLNDITATDIIMLKAPEIFGISDALPVRVTFPEEGKPPVFEEVPEFPYPRQADYAMRDLNVGGCAGLKAAVEMIFNGG